tara:strand:+ start:205 stop:399 length:195 start_codon:yes stop_codon:yes gene_type:complete
MVNMNMMGQMPGVQDTSEMAMQQAQAQLQAQFSPGALQAAQGIYGTGQQKDMSLIQRGTSAGVL